VTIWTAAFMVSAEEVDDVDRTSFTEEHLQEDKTIAATMPHSDIESAWIFPGSPESKVPVGGTTDLLVALANGGAKMFNVSHIEATLLGTGGKLALRLSTSEYGQSLGPLEQRSFRYPITLDAEQPLGEFKLEAKVYYNTRDKEPFVSLVCSEPVELVPPLPDGNAQKRLLQGIMGFAGLLMAGLLVAKAIVPADDSKAKGAKKPKGSDGGDERDEALANEWLSGTLAGTEKRASKKTKQG